MLSMWQILIVLGILLLFFGPSRLEKLGPSLGKAIRGFKKGLEDSDKDSDSDTRTKSKTEDTKTVELAESSTNDSKDTSKADTAKADS